jgi:hypothetical protein
MEGNNERIMLCINLKNEDANLKVVSYIEDKNQEEQVLVSYLEDFNNTSLYTNYPE